MKRKLTDNGIELQQKITDAPRLPLIMDITTSLKMET